MGTLKALMPNGAVIEREMSRPSRYSHGLAILRGDQWVLLSVHTSHAMASKNLKRLERSFCGGQAFGDYPEIEVIPLVRDQEEMIPIVRDSANANSASHSKVSPLSTTVRPATAA